MKRRFASGFAAFVWVTACSATAHAADTPPPSAATLEGRAAYGDWRQDRPGVRRHLTVDTLVPPLSTPRNDALPKIVPQPAGAWPAVPPGFTVERFATGFEDARSMRVAPNGDIFVADSASGQVRVVRAPPGAARAERVETFAKDLDIPFGIAFYPAGDDPRWVYVATRNTVVRFPYRSGDLVARDKPETIVPQLSPAQGGHGTRDLVFSADGRTMFVSIGAASDVAQDEPGKKGADLDRWVADHPLGAMWGDETDRADILAFDPDGTHRRTLATGIRNPLSLAVNPQTRDLWCTANERNGLGDDVAPDYVTRVKPGGFYGWPWYYAGANEDPTHKGERPDLRARVSVPDVLVQPHSAVMQIAFYPSLPSGPAAFPSDYAGEAFVALRGSGARGKRTGYKVVRLHLANGVPDGTYEDFLTGFVIDDGKVWARLTGVAVAKDGALLISEDGNNTIWRISYKGRSAAGP